MAIFKAFTKIYGEYFDVDDLLYADSYSYTSSSARISFNDGSSNYFTGTNFKYKTVSGVKTPSTGTIKGYTYTENGQLQVKMTGLNVSISTFMNYVNSSDTRGAFIYAARGNDKIYGSGAGDELLGFAGNDYMYGGNGNDSLSGGSGSDVLYGDAGADSLNGGSGNDRLYGGADADRMVGDRKSVV